MLNSLLSSGITDMWNSIINLFSFIPNYGWMIVVFTICLKLVLSPLDFWQRKVSRDTAKKQAKMQPELAKLQKKFGHNKQILNQKTMELYKREKFNVAGSCVGMLVNLALTLFIFISLFTSLIAISHDKILNQYDTLNATYQASIVQEYKQTDAETFAEIDARLKQESESEAILALGAGATEEEIKAKTNEIYATKIENAQNDVLEKYNEIKDSWLWVSSVWRPDTSASSFPNYADYVGMADLYNSQYYKDLIGENASEEKIAQVKADLQAEYNNVTAKVQEAYSGWNGYFILVILAAVVTYLSMVITQMAQSKKKQGDNVVQPQQAGAMKIMKYLMPILMIIFTIGYSAAFAIYIVVNSIMSVILSFTFLKLLEFMDKKKEEKQPSSNKPEYSR
ncbi:MAG: membrane protein insertase YidC [Clostridia bacterium]|nr:membrane protein insertase YidC [Clostridia bacterium]